ncbi:MAG: hypothetical protein GX596_11195 [Propionibacterium sp.]|nr:hypothetical protein [Propionibacterium sp.]
MSKSQELRKAAAGQASAAVEYGQKTLKDAWAKAQVVLDDGLDRALDALQKADAQARPVLKDAKVRSADFAARKLDEFEPHIRGALDKVQPAVESARNKVADDYLPRLSESLHSAAEHPLKVADAIRPAPKKSKFKTFVKVLVLGTLVAGAVAAVRHFLAPKDDGWTAHEHSRAYVNNNDTFATAAKVAAESKPAEPTEAEVQQDAPAEAAVSTEATEADATDPANRYGEGSFVGENPPEGFTIKGNERSMKFHVPGTGGYDRTIAEVWFTTEEAAEAAGFTKAQR